MSSSINFIRPIASALPELKTACEQAGILLARQEEVNKGAGVKLLGTIGNQPVALVLYYNRGKGISSKIVFERIPDHIRTIVATGLGIPKAAMPRTIPIHASFDIAEQTLRYAIKEHFLAAYPNLKEYQKPHTEYLAKIISSGHEVTITQFSSGVLLLQGAYSDLVDRVVDIIDRVKPLSSRERALLYVPEGSKQAVQDKMDERADVFARVRTATETALDGYVNFLFENDRKSLATGEALTEILEAASMGLPEYNFLVAIYAKVFEGFMIGLMIQKEFFTLEEYNANPEKPEIGNALRKKKLAKYVKDEHRYGYVIDNLVAVWEGCRCKEMHSDPIRANIISVGTLDEAKDRIGWIKTCMNDAYEVLVTHGYSDQDLLPKTYSPDSNSTSTDAETDSLKQNGYIGTDESGKGDYFGPLVVAGVYLDEASEKSLKQAGVQDSKKLSDHRIIELAKMIKSRLNKTQYSVVVIGPEKYNELYAKMNNLNRLLAWGHARSIENILTSIDCRSAISDQFGDESYIKKALLEKGKGIELLQMPKAEQHLAVAAASVLAREAFLERLAGLGKQFSIDLPKGGGSAEIEDVGRRFIEKYGANQLNKCAKLHFKTTKKLVRTS
jgi:ribonuclease HIII